MGQQLDRVSPTSLPLPSEEDMVELQKLGVIFGSKVDGPRNSKGQMCNVTLPVGWGVFEDSDRGDIWNGNLINQDYEAVARIFWMSKGSYDNECYMKLNNPTQVRRKLNKDTCVCKNGRFVVKLTLDEQKRSDFFDKCNDYAESQYRGSYQSELDTKFAQLEKEHKLLQQTFRVDSLPRLVKLGAQTSDSERTAGALSAVAIGFRKPYTYIGPSPWIQ